MLIQHILTEEIFSKVFGEDDFHRQNVSFFSRSLKGWITTAIYVEAV